MHETADDLARLQRQLDESYAKAGEHLKSIFRPERCLSAEGVVEELAGVFVLHLATVTAAGDPFVAPIDGLFFRGELWFGIPPGGLRTRHIRAHPGVSASYARGEDACVIVHGSAVEVATSGSDYLAWEAYGREVYGRKLWDYWNREHYRARAGDPLAARIRARRLYAMGPDRSAPGHAVGE